MAVDVLVMRHGETEANVQRVLVGREDSPFTSAGERHPLEVARHLAERQLRCVYTSPMARTRRTAAMVLQALGRDLPLRAEAAIAEIDAGEFTGLTFDEVRARVRDHRIDPDRFGGFRYPGGESWRDVQRRAVDFVSALEARHEGEEILLVTHAGVIAGLVAVVESGTLEDHIRTRFGHDFLGQLRVESGEIVDYRRLVGTVDSWF